MVAILLHEEEEEDLEFLPEDTSPEDVLPPGPVYQLFLSPGSRLYWTSHAGSQVNCLASRAARQPIRGDALLLSSGNTMQHVNKVLRCSRGTTASASRVAAASAAAAAAAAAALSLLVGSTYSDHAHRRWAAAHSTNQPHRLTGVTASSTIATGAADQYKDSFPPSILSSDGVLSSPSSAVVGEQEEVEPSAKVRKIRSQQHILSTPSCSPFLMDHAVLPNSPGWQPTAVLAAAPSTSHVVISPQPPAPRACMACSSSSNTACSAHSCMSSVTHLSTNAVGCSDHICDDASSSPLGGGRKRSLAQQDDAELQSTDNAESRDVDWNALSTDTIAAISSELLLTVAQAVVLCSINRAWRQAVLGNEQLLSAILCSTDVDMIAESGRNVRTALSTNVAAANVPGSAQPGPAESSVVKSSPSATMLSPPHLAMAPPPRRYVVHLDADAHAFNTDMQTPRGATMQQHQFISPNRGNCSNCPSGGVSPRTASELLRSMPKVVLAAAKAGNVSALVLLAHAWEAAGLREEALRMWWRRAALGGDPEGQFRLGVAAYEGSSGCQCDADAASSWLQRVVRQLLGLESLDASSLTHGSADSAGNSSGGASCRHAGMPRATLESHESDQPAVSSTGYSDGRAAQHLSPEAVVELPAVPQVTHVQTHINAPPSASTLASLVQGNVTSPATAVPSTLHSRGRTSTPATGASSAVSTILLAKVCSLPVPLRYILARATTLLGYMALDGEGQLGAVDRERAVAMFRLAAAAGGNDGLQALRTLGWLFNTGQYA